MTAGVIRQELFFGYAFLLSNPFSRSASDGANRTRLLIVNIYLVFF